MIHVYTGNGKGKTTAALGLAVRASGAGKKVFFLQFIKGRPYSETKAIRLLKNITLRQCGRGCFIKKKPLPVDIRLASEGLKRARRLLKRRAYDVVVLDEINIAMHLGLLKQQEVLEAIAAAPKTTDVVLTGRGAPRSIIRAADLVSEIKEVKHYFRKGVRARRGIET